MRVSVFVDAGYVFAQGSCAITGLKTPKPRGELVLNEVEIVELLKQQAELQSGGKELLRIYWYDGAPLSGPSIGQTRMGKLDNVKLRLGQLNSEGQQKGVDSLIVTDLMELARNKAISDAVIVTGDEDIRVGVQIAQSLGVRVHLLGITGPKGSQSQSLQQEADTVTEWDKPKVSFFLSTLGGQAQASAKKSTAKPQIQTSQKQATPTMDRALIGLAIQRTLDQLNGDPKKLTTAMKNAKAGKDIPGPVVTMLKAELQKSIGNKPTKSQNKTARDELSLKLRELK